MRFAGKVPKMQIDAKCDFWNILIHIRNANSKIIFNNGEGFQSSEDVIIGLF